MTTWVRWSFTPEPTVPGDARRRLLTGTFRQRTDPTKPQIDLYARLDLPLPKKVIEITPTGL